jgi:hypothetical protein
MADRFGVEMEFASASEDVKTSINHVVDIIRSAGLPADAREWQYSNGNSSWVCKPDASCGLEVCSPVLDRGDTDQIRLVMELLSKEPSLVVDHNCSVHLHVDFGNPSSDDLCSLLGWWVKYEHIFLDFAAPWRKTNRYCKFIGETCLFDHEEKVSLHRMFSKMSEKYLTLNTFHMFNRRRDSVEFRILEGTKNYSLVENWTNLVFNFVDGCRSSPAPYNYAWSDPEELFSFMKFEQEDLRFWFLERLTSNCSDVSAPDSRRSHAFKQYLGLKNK